MRIPTQRDVTSIAAEGVFQFGVMETRNTVSDDFRQFLRNVSLYLALEKKLYIIFYGQIYKTSKERLETTHMFGKCQLLKRMINIERSNQLTSNLTCGTIFFNPTSCVLGLLLLLSPNFYWYLPLKICY